jgi:hypothetical protein
VSAIYVLLVASGVAAALALVMRVVRPSVSELRVPSAVLGAAAAFGLGLALGAIAMASYGRAVQERMDSPANLAPAPPPVDPGPDVRTQLVNLVTKLDRLTQEPLFIELDAGQRELIREQLSGLEGLNVLMEPDAAARRDAILEALKDHRATLEAAGFSWPRSRPAAPGMGGFSPFRSGAPLEHLEDLRRRLAPAEAGP